MSTTSVMTFAEFEKLPDFEGKRELLHGEVIDMPPAKHLHDTVVKELFLLLLSTNGPTRSWTEAGYRVDDGWLIPDVSVSWPDQPVVDGYMSGSPMIAIEVASPANTAPQLYEKTRAYLKGGASEVWVAYPSGGNDGASWRRGAGLSR